MNKIERYNWASPGYNGLDRMVKINELLIDHSYQRKEVGEKNTLNIARNFNWNAFGSLVVMIREGGEKYVVDGQQRLLAAKKRGDIVEVPCRVFASDGRDHEAKAFVELNTRMARVSAFDKFIASASANINPEAEISAWLQNEGLVVCNNGRAPDAISFVGNLVSTWEIDTNACKKAIISQHIINEKHPMRSEVHLGLFWIIRNGIDIAPHIMRIIESGGIAAMLKVIKQVEIETNIRACKRLAGIALLRLINRGLRKNKIPIPLSE